MLLLRILRAPFEILVLGNRKQVKLLNQKSSGQMTQRVPIPGAGLGEMKQAGSQAVAVGMEEGSSW